MSEMRLEVGDLVEVEFDWGTARGRLRLGGCGNPAPLFLGGNTVGNAETGEAWPDLRVWLLSEVSRG